jgi:acyl-ACP thioesterase
MEGTTEFEVMIHDAGPDLKARVKSLFNYMQSAADMHSRDLGTSVSIMAEQNLTWVYSRFYAVIEQYPGLYDKISCETWRSVLLGNYLCREFLINRDNGITGVRATSSLALIDKNSRKPVPIPESIVSKLEYTKGRSIEFPSEIAGNINEFDYIYTMKTRYEDIDINGHMNNASYASVIFESVFENLSMPMIMKSIDISFRGEILFKDELECKVSAVKESPGKFYHRLYNKTKGGMSAYAVTRWVKDLKD